MRSVVSESIDTTTAAEFAATNNLHQSRVEQPRRPYPSFVRAHITLARLRALGGKNMQRGEEPKVEDAIKKIATVTGGV